MLSTISRSSGRLSNSRTSAPTMKPFSLPEMKTRPRICLSHAGIDALDDHGQLLERTPAEGILALALAIEHRPGDALHVDGEAPVPQRTHVQHGFCSEGHERPFSPLGEGARRADEGAFIFADESPLTSSARRLDTAPSV